MYLHVKVFVSEGTGRYMGLCLKFVFELAVGLGFCVSRYLAYDTLGAVRHFQQPHSGF